MITTTERPWNSATTLYIARKLEELAQGSTLKVLDVGCGDGTVMEQLLPYGHELYGYDLQTSGRRDGLRARMAEHFKDDFDRRIHFAPDERTIPFDDQSFDVIYANQVFEHVKFIDAIYGECARVLKPGGVMIALYPLATYPIELHAKIPFAHWMPPGRLRRCYLWPFYALRLRPRRPGMSVRESVVWWDTMLSNGCYYRFYNEIRGISEHYFEFFETDTGRYIDAKIDMLKSARGILRRMAGRFMNMFNGRTLVFLVTHGFGAVFITRNPRR